MPAAIFLSPFAANPHGHGGNHRAYQIVHDLGVVVGAGNVKVVQVAGPADPGAAAPSGLRPLLRLAARLRWKVGLTLENPVSLVARNRFYSRCFSDGARLRAVRSLLPALPRPAVCVVEHAGLVHLARSAVPRDVPTVACPANLESLDTATTGLADRRTAWAAGVDFASEARALAGADHRLCISRVETALLQGLGVTAHTYPYLPVGEVADELARIRTRREAGAPEAGLLVMLGSAHHATAAAAMEWLLDGLSPGAAGAGLRIVAAGGGTERFAGRWAGVEARGWVEQEELSRLLARCVAVLAPQRSGFGAVTRLAELSCAGVPVLVSAHALSAVDPPPGAIATEDDPAAWSAAISALRLAGGVVPGEDWMDWEARQPRTLQRLVDRLVGPRRGERIDGTRTGG